MKIKQIIYLNAGHFDGDPGVSGNGLTERDEVVEIRDLLIPLLKKHFKVEVCPDNKNLQQSVKWVNNLTHSLNDGIAFSIHMNFDPKQKASGAECFYYDWSLTGKKMANQLLQKYCDITKYKNRGAKPDRKSKGRYLWWIKKTIPWALLLEMCFINSKKDTDYFKNNREQIAKAIYQGICSIYKIKPLVDNKIEIKNKIAWHIGQELKLLEQL